MKQRKTQRYRAKNTDLVNFFSLEKDFIISILSINQAAMSVKIGTLNFASEDSLTIAYITIDIRVKMITEFFSK